MVNGNGPKFPDEVLTDPRLAHDAPTETAPISGSIPESEAAASPTGAPAGPLATAPEGGSPAQGAPASPDQGGMSPIVNQPDGKQQNWGHKMLAGILGALGGTENTEYSRDPQTGKLVVTRTPKTPGQQWKQIIAGALVGGAAGMNTRPGPGKAMRGGGAGFEAGMGLVQGQDQKKMDVANQDFDAEQKVIAQKATVAKINQDVAESAWKIKREQGEFAIKTTGLAADMHNLLTSDPQNEDMGVYQSFNDFIEKHGENAAQIGQMNANMELRSMPEFDAAGNLKGVHIYKVTPGWNEQKNTEPQKVVFGAKLGKDGSLEPDIQTIPAGGSTNAQIATYNQVGMTKLMEAQAKKSEIKNKDASTAHLNASTAHDNAETQKTKKETELMGTENDATAGSLAESLVEGNMDPSQLSKRSKDYHRDLKAANDYSMKKYGKPFDIAQATIDYKFAGTPATQNTLNYLNSLVGSDNKGGNLATLVDLSNKINRTEFPPLNDVQAWAKLNTGNRLMAQYHTAVTEVADQFAKIMQGGGTGNGTSDAKIKQGLDLFRTGFTKDQIAGVAETSRDLLSNRKKEMIGNNRYLIKQYGQEKKPSAGKFSKSAWLAKNPGGDINAAVQAAGAQNYEVVD